MSHRSGPGTLLDADLLTRLGRTLQELITVGGDAERSRAYLGVEVLANTGSATPPPAGFVQARIDGVAILCRYYGNEPAVGQFVDALSIQNSNPIVFQNHTTGLVGAGWPFDTEVVSVDSADPDADYDNVAAAIAALVAGNVIVQSPEQFTCDDETLIADTDLIGWDKLRSILYTTQATTLTLAGTNYLRDVTVHADGDDAGNIAAIDINVSNSELEHVVALAEQAGEGDVAGITVDGAANNILLTDVRAQGVSSNGGSEYGLYAEAGGSVQRVQGGHYDGDTADVYVAAGAEVYLYGAVLEGGVFAGPGDKYGWYWDGAGDFYLAPLSVLNSTLRIGSGFDIDPVDASGQDLGDATHRWDLYTQDVIFGGAAGTNVITIPDNVADALHIVDAGGLEYWRFNTTNAQPVTAVNLAGADIDFWVGISAGVPWFFVRGSDARVAVANANPGYEFDVLGNIGLVGGAANQDRYIYFATDAYIFWDESEDAFIFPKNVGIGGAPAQDFGITGVQGTIDFDVDTFANIVAMYTANTTGSLDINNTAVGGDLRFYATEDIHFRTATLDPAVTLLRNGDFGIGTPTPAARTEINAATADEPVLILQTTDDDDTNPTLDFQDSGGNSLLSISENSDITLMTQVFS